MSSANRISIRVSQTVAAELQQQVLDWAAHADTKTPVETVRERLTTILTDGRVDPLESYFFYQKLAAAAGADQTLQLPELAGLADRFNPHATILFNDFPQDRQAAVDVLDTVEAVLAVDTRSVRDLYVKQKQQELSFFHYVGAKNGWGISSWFTRDGEPPSVVRMRGSYRLLRTLEDFQVGLEIFRDGIVQGHFREDNSFVQKFLASPFAQFVGLHDALILLEHTQTDENRIQYARGIVGLAMDCGAEDAATDFAEEWKGQPEIYALLQDLLPSATSRFVSGSLTEYANDFLSLHHIGAYAAGGLVVRAAAGPLLSSGTISVATSHWGWRLLPGVWVFGRPVLQEYKTIAGLSRFIGNILVEAGKFTLILEASAVLVGKATGRHVGTMVYMGFLGGTMGWLSSLLAVVTAELHGVVEPLALRALLASGGDSGRLEVLLLLAATRVGSKQAMPIKTVFERFNGVVADIAKSEKTQALARGQITRLMNEATALTKRQPERVGEDFLQRLQQIAEKSDAVSAVREIRTVLDTTRQSVFSRLSQRATSASTPSTGPEPSKPRWLRQERVDADSASPKSTKGEPWRHGRPQESSAPVQERPVPTPNLSPAEALLAEPPPALTIDSAKMMTNGGIGCERAAWDKIVEFYSKNPSQRGAILRRLRELGNNLGGEWKSLEDVPHAWRGRVGIKHRLLVERVQGRTRIYEFLPRKHLESKAAWHPPKASDVIEL